MRLTLKLRADARPSLAKFSQPMNNCGSFVPFELMTTNARLAVAPRSKAGLLYESWHTIIDSVTDNKHYFYR